MRPAAEMERIRMKKSIVIGALLLIALALPFAALAEGLSSTVNGFPIFPCGQAFRDRHLGIS